MTAAVLAVAGRTFEALHVPNYRRFFLGQVVSVSGTWMQSVAQSWLVLRLTGSGVSLGLVLALQTLPMLLLGPWGGVVADRVDRRRALVGTQAAAGLLALALGLLTATATVELWMVYALAVLFGLVTVVDMPTRQSFVSELVGSERLTNAVSLNSVLVNSARVVGPALAGLLIATVGIAACFLVNAASYAAVIVGLLLVRPEELYLGGRAAAGRGGLREAARYVWARPVLRTPLLLMAVVGTLAYEFQVTLPLLARATFHAGPGTYGAMTAVMGGGSVLGGLVAASRGRPTGRRLLRAAFAFGLLLLAAALMPTLGAELAALALMGAASITFIALSNSTLQLNAAPEMRGRVMALYGVAFLGSTPVGGPLVGWVGGTFGARAALLLGAVATLLAALAARQTLGPPAAGVASGAPCPSS